MSFAQDSDASSNVDKNFLSAAEEVDKKHGLLYDMNAFFSCDVSLVPFRSIRQSRVFFKRKLNQIN